MGVKSSKAVWWCTQSNGSSSYLKIHSVISALALSQRVSTRCTASVRLGQCHRRLHVSWVNWENFILIWELMMWSHGNSWGHSMPLGSGLSLLIVKWDLVVAFSTAHSDLGHNFWIWITCFFFFFFFWCLATYYAEWQVQLGTEEYRWIEATRISRSAKSRRYIRLFTSDS